MHKTFITCILALIASMFSSASFAADTTKVVSRQSLFVIPHVVFQQETSFAGGLAAGYYFKSNNLKKISSVAGSAYYTLLKQFTMSASPKIFFGQDKRWYLFGNLNLRKYPDYFYGIGNKKSATKQAYVSNNFMLLLQPQYSITKQLLIGVSAGLRSENTKVQNLPPDNYNTLGWQPYRQVDVGALATFDTRNNQFYSESGMMAKLQLSTSTLFALSTFATTDVSVDFRHFIPIFDGHTFAYQSVLQGVFSGSDVPFQLLPTLGGRDVMRGYRQGMYRDNLLFVAQAEYRLPLYKRLKMAAFCSAGDVMHANNIHIDKLKVAYGVGLRYRINDARVHLRVDIAKNNYGEKLQFYITATEAF